MVEADTIAIVWMLLEVEAGISWMGNAFTINEREIRKAMKVFAVEGVSCEKSSRSRYIPITKEQTTTPYLCFIQWHIRLSCSPLYPFRALRNALLSVRNLY